MAKTLTGNPLNNGANVVVYPDPTEPDQGLSDLATSDGSQDATLQSGATVVSAPKQIFGSVDGTSGGWAAGPLPSIDITSPITIAAWIYIPSTSPCWNGSAFNRRYGMILVHNQAGEGFYMGTDGGINGLLSLDTRIVSSSAAFKSALTPNLTSPVDAWHHFVLRFDGSIQTAFIDGASGSSTTVSGITSGADLMTEYQMNGQALRIQDVYGPRANILVSSLRIYNRALSDAEIGDLYTAGLSGDSALVTTGGGVTVTQDSTATSSASAFDASVTVGPAITVSQDSTAQTTATAFDAAVTVGPAVTVSQDATAQISATAYDGIVGGGGGNRRPGHHGLTGCYGSNLADGFGRLHVLW